eukprot:5027312-Amphidinium_carterae.1
MQAGEFCIVRYRVGGPELWHERLVLHAGGRGNYFVRTPDLDEYTEGYQPGSPDVMAIRILAHQGDTPEGIYPDRVYRFDPTDLPSDTEFERQARAVAAGFGVQMPAGPLLLQRAGYRAPPPVPVRGLVAMEDRVWVALETRGLVTRGSIVTPGVDALIQEDRGLIRSGGVLVSVALIARREIPDITNEDLRVLDVPFDGQNQRRRTFASAVESLADVAIEGGDVLEGPRSGMWLARHCLEGGGSFIGNHAEWVRDSGLSSSDRSIHESECIARTLDYMLVRDQLNGPALVSFEVLCRRLQLIRAAHHQSPASPDYSMAEPLMGWGQKLGMAPHLAQH